MSNYDYFQILPLLNRREEVAQRPVIEPTYVSPHPGQPHLDRWAYEENQKRKEEFSQDLMMKQRELDRLDRLIESLRNQSGQGFFE